MVKKILAVSKNNLLTDATKYLQILKYQTHKLHHKMNLPSFSTLLDVKIQISQIISLHLCLFLFYFFFSCHKVACSGETQIYKLQCMYTILSREGKNAVSFGMECYTIEKLRLFPTKYIQRNMTYRV